MVIRDWMRMQDSNIYSDELFTQTPRRDECFSVVRDRVQKIIAEWNKLATFNVVIFI